jgi:O-antigen ligase
MLFNATNHKTFLGHAIWFLLWLIIALIQQQFFYLVIPFFSVLFSIKFQIHQLYYALFFCFPLSTELQITPTLGLDFPTEPILIALSIYGILIFIKNPKLFPKSLITNNLFLLISLYLCWLVFIILFSTTPILSLKFFIAKIWYVVPLVILPQIIFEKIEYWEKLFYAMLLAMGFVCFQSVLRHSFYSFSFEGIKQTLHPFFRNHVNYSGMLVSLLPFAYYWYKTKTISFTLTQKTIAIVATAATLFLAYSRGAWLALVVGCFTYWLTQKRWLKKALLILSLVFVMATTWLLSNKNYLQFTPNYNTTIFHTNFKEHLQATIALKDISNAERFYRWVAAGKMITEKPLVGFGTNSFYSNYKHYTAEIFKTWVSSNKDHSTVHNYFLLVATEQGLIGLGFFLILFFALLLQANKFYWNSSNKKHQQLAITIITVITIIGVLNFLSDLVETDKIGSIFWLCLSMLIWLQYKSKNVITPP